MVTWQHPALAIAATFVLASVAACVSPRPGEPWVAELGGMEPGVGRHRVLLYLEEDDGRLRGGSRRRAMSALTGSTLVRIYEWLHPRHGSLVELEDYASREGGAEFVLDTPTGRLCVEGQWSESDFVGRWRGPGLGASAGSIHLSRWGGARERLDVDAVATLDAFAAELDERFAFPARLDDAWHADLGAARERAADVVDDFELVALTALLCEPISNSALLLRDARKPSESSLDLAWREDVAVITAGAIADGLDAIDEAFEQVLEEEARALILDLRGCVGYDLTAGRMLAYLAPREEPLGYMLGRRRADAGPLGDEERDGLTVVTCMYSFGIYRRMLGLTGIAAGGVAPLADGTFEGPVAVLCDRHTRAAIEPVIDYLQRSGRARVFGEATAGAPVDAELVALPVEEGVGWTAVIPVATWVRWDGAWMEREPVKPDVAVDPKLALEAAQAWFGPPETIAGISL